MNPVEIEIGTVENVDPAAVITIVIVDAIMAGTIVRDPAQDLAPIAEIEEAEENMTEDTQEDIDPGAAPALAPDLLLTAQDIRNQKETVVQAETNLIIMRKILLKQPILSQSLNQSLTLHSRIMQL